MRHQAKPKITAALLAVALLAGCGAQNSAPAPAAPAGAVGRWEETAPLQTESADSILFGVTRLADGTLRAFANGAGNTLAERALTAYRSTDEGASWQVEETGWNAATGAGVRNVWLAPNGTALLQTQDAKDACALWTCRAGGVPEPFAFSGVPEEYALCRDGLFLDSTTFAATPTLAEGSTQTGSLFLYDMTQNAVKDWYDTAGSVGSDTDNRTGVTTTYGPTYGMAAGGGGRLYYTKPEGSGGALHALGADGADTVLLSPLPDGSGYDQAAADADGNYYYINEKGIYRLAVGGNLAERVVDGTGFAFGNKASIWGLTVTAAGDFLVNMGSSLYRYHHLDEAAAPGSAGALNVWSLADSATTRAAITAYRTKHPDVALAYTPVLDDGTTTRDDALRALNTALLAGSGPDVLILDGVDPAPYAEKGFLADLTAVLDTDALAPNIVAGWQQTDGKLCALPARFALPVVMGENVDGITTLDGLKTAILAAAPRPDVNAGDDAYYAELPETDRYALDFLSVEQVVDFVLQTSAPALYKDGAVNTGAVREFLTWVQEVSAHYGMQQYRAAALQEHYSAVGGAGGTDPVAITDGLAAYHGATRRAVFGWATMQTPALCCLASPATDGSIPAAMALQPGLVQGAYTPQCVAAINAASPQSEQAAAFVQELFGSNAQANNHGDGLPVATQYLTAAVQANGKAGAEVGYTGDLTALVAGAKTPVTVDPTLRDAMLDHAQKLVSGEEDLTAAATGVQTELALVLAEGQ